MTKAHHPRGFASLLAVWSLLLVGITIACLMRRFSSQAVRTREEADRAQLRQMIIAGALSKPDSPVKLPEELSKTASNIDIDVHFDKDESLTVTAEIDKRHERWSGKLR
jgi:type II secretory pathway component PulK